MSQRFTFVWQRRNLRPPKAYLWFPKRLPGMINYKLLWQTFVWTFIIQDKQDENHKRCGNFYGSTSVLSDNFKEGLVINANLKATYNLSTNSELIRFCSENFLNKLKIFFSQTLKRLKGYNKSEIPDDCVCGKVNLIQCRRQKKLPESFPKQVNVDVVLTFNLKSFKWKLKNFFVQWLWYDMREFFLWKKIVNF